MSGVSTETALFVSTQKAVAACRAAMAKPNVETATPHRRFSRGQLLGYWVCLKMTDGTLTEMSEDYAEGIFT